jgi:hypothetical protein
VSKDEEKVFFETDSLMYAAIFSDKELYECQVQRLMKRTKQMSDIYTEKILLVSKRGCSNGFESELMGLSSSIETYQSSEDLKQIAIIVSTLNQKNENYFICRIW